MQLKRNCSSHPEEFDTSFKMCLQGWLADVLRVKTLVLCPVTRVVLLLLTLLPCDLRSISVLPSGKGNKQPLKVVL